jgi:hypothetical protein
MKGARLLASVSILVGTGIPPAVRAEARVAGVVLRGVPSESAGEAAEVAGIRLEAAPRDARPDTFGTTAPVLIQVPATACTPINGTTASFGVDGWVSPSASIAFFDCPINPPEGASLVAIELVAHDASDGGAAVAILAHCDLLTDPGISCIGVPGPTSTGTAAIPTTARVSQDVSASNIVVDRSSKLYLLRVGISGAPGSVQFREAGVFYRLRISVPEPGTQTFGDVPPSHTYWKAIEALAASGITGGCGSGNFCPNQNVTRGEIAAFLARALGLHFPN